jgi:hypothetical protein
MRVPTVRVMPTHQSQGEWVEINESDFDPTVHTLYEPDAPQQEPEPAKKRGRPRKTEQPGA